MSAAYGRSVCHILTDNVLYECIIVLLIDIQFKHGKKYIFHKQCLNT